MVKLSQFAFDHAEDMAEVDLNPVIVHGDGAPACRDDGKRWSEPSRGM